MSDSMKSATKAWSFLILLSLTLVVLGHYWGGREGLLLALVAALGINSYVYFFEDHRVLSLFSGRRLEGQDSYGLREIVRRLSLKARIPTPRIVILPTTAPQAGVVGRGLTHCTILITEGCLQRFSRNELEAVIAYQLASVQTMNTLAFVVGSFLMSAGLMLSDILDSGLRLLIFEKKNQQIVISQIFTRFFSPAISMLLRLSVQSSNYKTADVLAAQMIDNPKLMAETLRKLDSYARTLPANLPLSSAHMFTVSPLTDRSWTHRFVTHPKTADRIRNLVGYYPI
jgi:heat shock protein HtpX